MEQLFPVVLLAVASVAVKHAVDILPDNASSFAKVLASYAISVILVFLFNFRLLAEQGVEANGTLDALITAFILSALASKVAHPLVELVKSIQVSRS